MKIKNQLQSRRNFLKGAVINGAALSALPATALATSKNSDENQIVDEDKIPRLPLRIYLSNGIEEQFRGYINSLSDKITFIDPLEDNELQTEIPDIDAWFGYISREQFLQAKKLRWIQSTSAGVERYVYPELVNSQVMLTNAKGCYGPAIGEHAIGLLFSLTRQLVNQTRNMAVGKWERQGDMVEMKGKTMGIVGFGGIGSQVARRARAMDMKIIAVDIVPKYKEQIGDNCDEIRLVQDGGLEWLMKNADVVVSAAPHTKISEGMFDRKHFMLMKPGSYFINVSRGKLVRTNDLVEVLKSGHLAGAGLDVTDPEPLPPDHELWKLSNVVITSHIAAQSQYSFIRMQNVFSENVDRFIKGLPLQNLVDKAAGF
jgi:phosphoglycerate dehydrogenase-like enzyme